MKFSLLAAVSAISAIAQVSAVTVVSPWATSVWTAGGHGNITWTITDAEANLKCDIYLLNGDFKNSNIVAQITDPNTPVACSALKYDMYPLNDFAAGQYWIRIGQSATGTWAYSSPFQFNGNGTSKPISIVSQAGAAATAAAVSGAAASGVASASGSAVAAAASNVNAAVSASGSVASSAAASSHTSGAASMTINAAAVAMGAVAAVALTL